MTIARWACSLPSQFYLRLLTQPSHDLTSPMNSGWDQKSSFFQKKKKKNTWIKMLLNWSWQQLKCAGLCLTFSSVNLEVNIGLFWQVFFFFCHSIEWRLGTLEYTEIPIQTIHMVSMFLIKSFQSRSPKHTWSISACFPHVILLCVFTHLTHLYITDVFLCSLWKVQTSSCSCWRVTKKNWRKGWESWGRRMKSWRGWGTRERKRKSECFTASSSCGLNWLRHR